MDCSKIKFKDKFEADNDICEICGCDGMRAVGYNKKEDLLKYECPECGAVIIEDGSYNTTIIKGEKRDWSKYFAENLSLPFEAVVVEGNDADIFSRGRSGPNRNNDILTVISVGRNSARSGVMVTVKKGWKKYKCPIEDLEPTDKKSANAKLLYNYGNWRGSQYL